MKKNLLFAILCVLGLFGTLNAQEVVTIDGTVGGYDKTTANNAPIMANKSNAVTQQYYTAAEIGGKQAGTIESIAFKTADATFPCERTLVIYMRACEETHFNSSRSMVQVSEDDIVYSGTVNFTSAESWINIDIDDFKYEGTNLLVCVRDTTGAYLPNSAKANFYSYKKTASEDGASRYCALYKDGKVDPTASSIQGKQTTESSVPFIQFVFAAGTAEEYQEPVTPTNFVATVLNESKVQLTWEGDANNSGYNIYQGTEVIAKVTETSYTVKNLVPGEYYFSVKGANGPKESEAVGANVTIVAKTVASVTVGQTFDGESFTAPMSLLNPGEPAKLDSWVEQLYTAEEIGGARTIERLSFPIKCTIDNEEYRIPVTTKEIKIYLAETTATDYTSQSWTAKENLILVYSDTDIIIGDQEWETFEFDAPFNYSGEKNLAVVVAKSADESTGVYLWHTNSVANSVLYSNDTYAYPTVQGNVTGTRPVVRFAWETEEVEPTPTVPAAPVVETTVTETTVTLTWAAVEGATSYKVYQGENAVSVETTTYTVEGLEAGTEYCFNVTAVNEAGESAKTEACATTDKADEPIVPGNPEIGLYPTTFLFDFENGNLNGLNVIDANNDGVKWQYKNGMEGGVNDGKGVYSGQAGGDKADDYLVTASKYSMTTTSEFSFTFVPYDYYWCEEKIAVVVSENGEAFETVWSYEFNSESYNGKWQDTTVDLKAYAGKDLYVGLYHYGTQDGIRVDNIKLYSQEPSAPANLAATATETTITLTWDAVDGAKSYNVYAVEGEDYTLVGNATTTTFTVEDLKLETEYTFSVTAVNEFKESRYAVSVTISTALPEGVEVLLKETFESYEVGQYIAKDGAEHWTTWSKKEGGSEDGKVVDLNGNKAGYLTFGNDQVLLLGGYKSGEFDLELDVYVPAGSAAYYNVLHEFNGNNSSWAMQSYLHMTDNGMGNPAMAEGHGSVHAGEANVADIPCIYDAWMHFRMHINANTDKAELYYTMPGAEEVKACEWQWSKDCFGESVVGRKLDAMNFYPSNNKSKYYIDNLSLKRYGGAASAIVTIDKEEIKTSMDVDDMTSVELEIENIGTSIAEYVAWVDYGQGAMSDKAEVVSYSLEDISTSKPIGWGSKTLTFEVAALYPSSSYGNSVMGTYVTAAAYFLGDFKDQLGNSVPMLEPGTNMVFRIYSQGINGVPGKVLAEKVLPAEEIILDWNVVFFDEPVLLTGFDFYAAVEMTQAVDGVPMVLDGNTNGQLEGYGDLCRQSSSAAFRSISDFIEGDTKYGNLHIMVMCEGDPVKGGWAELSKKDGVLEIGAKETIDVNFVSVGLEKGKTYDAKVVFNTNTEEGVIEIPVSLNILGENVEEILSNTYNIYPNPTAAQVTVEGENINYIAVYNSVGQLVKVVRTQNNVVDMSANDNGVYFFNIVDNAGQSSVQRVVVAK